jgi:hypothetical protein
MDRFSRIYRSGDAGDAGVHDALFFAFQSMLSGKIESLSATPKSDLHIH